MSFGRGDTHVVFVLGAGMGGSPSRGPRRTSFWFCFFFFVLLGGCGGFLPIGDPFLDGKQKDTI